MREIKALYLANAREFMREPMAMFLVPLSLAWFSVAVAESLWNLVW